MTVIYIDNGETKIEMVSLRPEPKPQPQPKKEESQ